MVCFLEKFFDHAAKTVAAEENDRIAGFSCAAKEGEQVGRKQHAVMMIGSLLRINGGPFI